MRELAGMLEARGLRFGIALSRFNARVGELLLAGAHDTLMRLGAEEDAITVVRVPGAWELPQALRFLADAKPASRFDGLLALGAIVRGETPHFDQLAATVTRALERLAHDTGLPLAYGLLTCDTSEQALERAGGKHGNKGADAALAAVELVQIKRSLAGGR